MLLGLMLELLMLISHADLHKGSSGAVNKFLITDDLLRKAELRDNPSAEQNASGLLQPASSASPAPAGALMRSVNVTVSAASSVANTSRWMPIRAGGAKMELMQRDRNSLDVANESFETNSTEPEVNREEQLIGQFMVCDSIYELQCSGGHCVQVTEGSTTCVLDQCREHLLISCRNGRGCYSHDQHCDEVADCDDASDERNCLTLVQVHDERHFYTRTVPFMAILCLMGVAGSFVLYHQTNAARQRQRHLSMVGLTNALTTAGLAQRLDAHHGAPRAWRTRDGPSAGLLGDLPDTDPLAGSAATLGSRRVGDGGATTIGDGSRMLHDLEQLGHAGQQLQLLPSSPDGYCDDDPLDTGTYGGGTGGGVGYYYQDDGYRVGRYSAELSPSECSAPPPYEAALEMGTLSDLRGAADQQVDVDPPPYESVSHIMCTSVIPVSDV